MSGHYNNAMVFKTVGRFGGVNTDQIVAVWIQVGFPSWELPPGANVHAQ